MIRGQGRQEGARCWGQVRDSIQLEPRHPGARPLATLVNTPVRQWRQSNGYTDNWIARTLPPPVLWPRYQSMTTPDYYNNFSRGYNARNSQRLYLLSIYCEAQGKGRARGGPRKVTERSFMDCGWWMVDILSLMLYTKVGCHPPTRKFNFT